MTNVWVICRKELRSYFASPIAYAVMALFALIFGIWFYCSPGNSSNVSFRSQMSGGRATDERQRIHYPPDTRIRGNHFPLPDSLDQHAAHR